MHHAASRDEVHSGTCENPKINVKKLVALIKSISKRLALSAIVDPSRIESFGKKKKNTDHVFTVVSSKGKMCSPT